MSLVQKGHHAGNRAHTENTGNIGGGDQCRELDPQRECRECKHMVVGTVSLSEKRSPHREMEPIQGILGWRPMQRIGPMQRMHET